MTRSRWRKSSYSGNQGDCVEVAIGADEVGVRDTKNRAAGNLTVAPAAWSAFVRTAGRAMR
ncbi:DUF397 domain-containing protein [Amycolatopsis sp. CA-230715]|uniref:DUF397 domain-containing protein n=1 Tax=Amycolatopsis sp. CA-230715 TaxID=2745196 RepID=UPI001C01655D|nr:DUF397 domain-containing protein [Amycolatopsis sp. CA-230715]QWF77735.1 hypothetical protein HUW46_01127 [Amycolatopsis sp. CA-230715]